ncbi:hypothetical protein LOK49_LG12G00621 [Camellia lanceoleosa]|uniref:Uncharacterized protein n=1 Tax=Camellia lanceoleosa TaxID=1840588 RepID=A0ACC0FSQ5_9ERIC|nr:hypothetical protein LOK49_LG12G00621 [Camellia lanceoleosa]
MAPTAAMLILGYQHHHHHHHHHPQPPSSPPSSSVLQVKASAMKWWVSSHHNNPISHSQGRPGLDLPEEAARKSMVVDDPSCSSSDSALEIRFQKDLQFSCW